MNIQAMMKQAQQLQKEMLSAKNEIDKTIYTGTSSFVTVKLTGAKKVESINIDMDSMDKDDIDMLQDLLTVAINDAMNQIDKETEQKLGKYTKGMPGLF